MFKSTLSRVLLILPVLLLSGCEMGTAKLRVGVLVLVPFLLLIAVLWLLNRRSAGEDDWEQEHFPDADDDDDNEDHFLM
jgi:hypothetical protein